MRYKERLKYVSDDGLRLYREADEVESMTPEEVNANLRLLGLEPATVLPAELQRLWAGETPGHLPAYERPGFSPASQSFAPALTTPRTSSPLVAAMYVLVLLGITLISVIISLTFTDGGSKAKMRRREGPENASVKRTSVSDDGSDANPCSTKEPCKTLMRAVAVTPRGGEITFDGRSPEDWRIYRIVD